MATGNDSVSITVAMTTFLISIILNDNKTNNK